MPVVPDEVFVGIAYLGAPAVHPWRNAIATMRLMRIGLMFIEQLRASRLWRYARRRFSPAKSLCRWRAGAASERARVKELCAHWVIDFGRVEYPERHRRHTHIRGARRI